MSDGKIKTAMEKALERSEQFREVSAAELKMMEYKPKGNTIAGNFLNNNTDITSELEQTPEDIRSFVLTGIEETLLQNITLPENERAGQISKKALAGLQQIKEDNETLNHIISELEYLFNYYQQAVEQAKSSVHAKLAHKFQAAMQQMEAQYGSSMQVDLESQPEFQTELRKVTSDLNQRFESSLQQAKTKIKSLN
ncbi:MAG: hypothetical protein FH758_13410 [Firmicutes bacterium]|nr:hypothetical protein [Bacillota bacterium]